MEECIHLVRGSRAGTRCGGSYNGKFWLQAYVAEAGIENLIKEDDGWTCSVCIEARQSYSECCCIGATRHVREIMIWLAMSSSKVGSIY